MTTKDLVVFFYTEKGIKMDENTLRHAFQVADIAKEIADSFMLTYFEVLEITIAALYYDIGKEYVPDIILSKPTGLSDNEYEIMKLHTRLGSELLSKFSDKTMQLAAEVALNHHTVMAQAIAKSDMIKYHWQHV